MSTVIGGFGCLDDCEGERGERGKRGKRGHRGHSGHDGLDGSTGATGPTGPASSGGSFLKFAGAASALAAPSTVFNFLTDAFQLVTFNPGYPVPTARTLRNIAVDLLSGIPTIGTLTVELLVNGVVQPAFTIVFTGPLVGGVVQTAVTAPLPIAVGDRISLRTTTSGFAEDVAEIDLTAMLGVE